MATTFPQFIQAGKEQPPPPSPDVILQGVLTENPGLAKVFNPKNTSVIFAKPDRLQQLKQQGMQENQLEYWPPQETGTPAFPRPTGTKGHVLEIYRKDLMTDSNKLKQAIYGDLLHGMSGDPYFAALKKEFVANYTPETKAFEAKQNRGGNPEAVNDMYIRGWLSPDERDEFRKNQAQSGKVYSPRQIQILNEMKRYISTGQPKAK
jgi:hypothetical protein